jgi:hypothetical protein
MKKMTRSDLLRFSICLIIWVLQLRADKTGASEGGKPPISISIVGLKDEGATHSCLKAINRDRKRMLVIPDKGEGDYQIVIERRRPGFLVRVEKMGTALKSARALFDYEVCIAAAAISREAISDE